MLPSTERKHMLPRPVPSCAQGQADLWLADATNGITDFFAKIGHFDKVCAKKLCAGSACIDEQRLAAILAGISAGAPQQGRNEAPATAPASDRGDDADSSTTSTETSAASSTSDILSPSSTETESEAADSPDTHTETAGSQPEPTLDGQPIIPRADDSGTTAANDNDVPSSLPAAGTH
jgi:hypothetical protein